MSRYLTLQSCICRPSVRHRTPLHALSLRQKIRISTRAEEEPVEAEVDTEDAETRIARLEAAARRGRGVTDAPETEDLIETPPKRRWKEGELLPEGWDDLNLGEKAWQLYAGERGALFWANKIAFAAAIIVGVAWIFFRFVGPQLGLYELKSTFTS